SINKIYDVTALVGAGRADEAWADAAGLFDLTGDPAVLKRFRDLTSDMLAIPSATALERGPATHEPQRGPAHHQPPRAPPPHAPEPGSAALVTAADLYVAAIRT